ncbi:hypothetical protein ACN1C3_03745 [Pseudomonas sp. H11T01]
MTASASPPRNAHIIGSDAEKCQAIGNYRLNGVLPPSFRGAV